MYQLKCNKWSLDKTKGQGTGFIREIEDSLYRCCLLFIPKDFTALYRGRPFQFCSHPDFLGFVFLF